MLRPVEKNHHDKPIERPVNYELEAEILGTPLAASQYNSHEAGIKALQDVLALPRDAFVRHDHRIIHDAYLSLSERDLSPTDAHLRQVLLGMGQWSNNEAQGGIGTGFLVELQDKGGIASELLLLCHELNRLKWKRDFIDEKEKLHDLATNWHDGATPDIATSLDRLNRIFASPPDGRKSSGGIATLLAEDLHKLEQQASGEVVETRIWTGFTELDKCTGGLSPGNLVVVAGRPTMGKTSLALDVALRTAMQGIGTMFFSFEMTSQEIIRRVMSKVARINVLRLRHGELEDWQLVLYRKAAQEIGTLPMSIFDSNFVPREIEQQIQSLNRKLHPEQIRLVVADHLQIMGTRDGVKYERRDRQLATYTSQLKDIAKANECCVLLLSQLNRLSEHRPLEQRQMRLSDLRESGAIEQDADIVIGLYRTQVDDPVADPHQAELVILKNRSGPIGRSGLHWISDLASFKDESSTK